MIDHTPAGVRYLVAFLSVMAGIGFTGLDIWYSTRYLPWRSETTPQESLELSRLSFEACITFYGVVCWCGRRLYTLFHRKGAAAELQQWSAWYLLILNTFGGGWLLILGWWSFRMSGLFKPSLLIAVALLTQTGVDLFRTAIASRGSPNDL